MTSLLLVPGPDVSITGGSGTLYAGSELTLTCNIPLGSALVDVVDDDIVEVTSRWYGPGGQELPPTGDCEGERVCVSGQNGGGIFYTSTVVFNTLRTGDDGDYNCTATVSIPSFSDVTDGRGTFVMPISVESKFCTV